MADEPVLLGLADGNMEENDDKICGWSTNKIGGKANWLFGQPSDYPTCPLCGELLYLVCQIYCPLSNSVFHRVLYIFGCGNTSCWNTNKSWKVLRSQAKDSNFVSKKTIENKSSSAFEVDDWCDDAEDWGEDDDFSSALEQCTGKLQLSDEKPEEDPNKELQLNTSQQHKENSMAFVPHFAPMYITVIEAPDTRGISTQMTKHEKALLSEYQQREGGHVLHSMDADEDSKGWSGEKYESASVKHGNKAFHKFNKQLYACPQQCLRYQWNGLPISMVTTKPSELCSSVLPCQHCGAHRVFELQFMPGLIGNLKLAKQTYSTKDLDSQNDDHNTETEQFADSNNKYNLGRLRNTTHDENEGILTVDLGLREDQRKTFLATVNQVHDVTIEFGTVMVFTCSKSCWSETESVGEAVYLEEFCLVEADPDALLFK